MDLNVRVDVNYVWVDVNCEKVTVTYTCNYATDFFLF